MPEAGEEVLARAIVLVLVLFGLLLAFAQTSAFMKTQIDVLVLESYLIAKPAATLADVAGRAALRSA